MVYILRQKIGLNIVHFQRIVAQIDIDVHRSYCMAFTSNKQFADCIIVFQSVYSLKWVC